MGQREEMMAMEELCFNFEGMARQGSLEAPLNADLVFHLRTSSVISNVLTINVR